MREISAEQRRASSVGGVVGAILGSIAAMVVVYITIGDAKEFNVWLMLFFGFIGLAAGLLYGWSFSLLLASRFSIAISVIVGILIAILLVPICSFCCLMFWMV